MHQSHQQHTSTKRGYMTHDDTRPTIGERYSTACVSSDLRLREVRSDVDYLIAAGLSSSQFGATLFRLRSEFDTVKAQIKGQGANSLVDRVLILSQLGTLHTAKQQLGAYSIKIATRRAFMEPDEKVLILAGRSLDLFLDPTCDKCEGRGKNGGYGSPEVICRSCGGSGKRHISQKIEAHKAFIQHMVSCMEMLTANTESEVGKLLRIA